MTEIFSNTTPVCLLPLTVNFPYLVDACMGAVQGCYGGYLYSPLEFTSRSALS